jgi:cytochrome c biogenesis protein ResB
MPLLLAGLASGKLALVLIALLMLLAAVGAMLPQEGLLTPADTLAWQYDHPIITRLAEPWGLFDTFSCWPFLGTILVLAVNTLTCTILRFVREGGFRSLAGPMAAKRTGFVLLHLSLIILFAGGFWSAATRLDGHIVLTEGQHFTDTHDSYLRLQEGPLRPEQHTGLEVRLESVDIEYEQQRYSVAVSSNVGILSDGEQVASGVVQVNSPFTYAGLSLTQDETGFSPRLMIRDGARGGTLFDSFIALKTFRTDAGREYRDFLPIPFLEQRIVVTLYPNFTLKDGELVKTGEVPNNPLLLLEIEDESGQVVESRQVEVGSRVRLGKYLFAFVDLRRWASFRVGDDPGYPWFCAGLWLGLASLLLRYFPDLRCWFHELTPQACTSCDPPPSDKPLPSAIETDSLCVRLS